ncbi:hypothetical protein HYT24_01705 [Candidatus Pacearchaeota archaeon]|nr:hypothetical protein [Candidatus Pacearchaeota archaeon]
MELTQDQLIRILLGMIVIAAVLFGLYNFGSNINEFFKGNLTSKTESLSLESEQTSGVIIVKDCQKCGEGVWNACDEKECRSINQNCIFKERRNIAKVASLGPTYGTCSN